MTNVRNRLFAVIALIAVAFAFGCGGKTERDEMDAEVAEPVRCFDPYGSEYECPPHLTGAKSTGSDNVGASVEAAGERLCSEAAASGNASSPLSAATAPTCCIGADLCHVRRANSTIVDFLCNGINGQYMCARKDTPTTHFRGSYSSIDFSSTRRNAACACLTLTSGSVLSNSTGVSECNVSGCWQSSLTSGCASRPTIFGPTIVNGTNSICGRPNRGWRAWLHSALPGTPGRPTCAASVSLHTDAECTAAGL